MRTVIKMKFKIMTWNVENLFPVSANGPGPKDKTTYEAKIANLVRTITNIAPDVLAVQEIGSEETFRDLGRQAGGDVGRPAPCRPGIRRPRT